MTIKVVLRDSLGNEVTMGSDAAYNPDILDDLTKRAKMSYKMMMRQHWEMGIAGKDFDEDEEVDFDTETTIQTVEE